MTSSVVLLLKGPMQSWDDRSRYKRRTTRPIPTKSGVIGLLAAAQGRRRTDPIEDLARLRFAVRVDDPGTLLRDYQTAQSWQTGGKTNLVARYYLSDAAFLAAVESDDDGFIEALHSALRAPRFPLYLGRRSCPAPVNLALGVDSSDAVTALRKQPWMANERHRAQRSKNVALPIFRDAKPGEVGVAAQDVPVSFSQEHRQYEWRQVVEEAEPVRIDNPNGGVNDPFFEAVLTV